MKRFNHSSKQVKAIIAILILCAVLALYFTVVIPGLFRGEAFSISPIKLIKSIGEYGFQINVFFFIYAALLLVVWRISKLSMEESKLTDDRKFKYSSSGIYGTAGFLNPTKEEIEGVAKIEPVEKAQGTILAQMDKKGEETINVDIKTFFNRNVAVFGAPGTRKSRGYVITNITQCAKRKESVIITDPKGELYEVTSQYMREQGYVVRVLNLVNPELSDMWYCLKETFAGGLRPMIFADILINASNQSGTKDIWADGKKLLLQALILRVTLGEDYRQANAVNMESIYELISKGPEFLMEKFEKTSIRRDAPSAEPALVPFGVFAVNSPNAQGNIVSGLGVALQIFQNKDILKMTSGDEIDLTLPAKRPCAYYVIMSDQHRTLEFMSSIFFSFLFMDLVEHIDLAGVSNCVPVHMMLEEAPNIGEIYDFQRKINTLRGRRIDISFIFQSIPQLTERWPRGLWEAILASCDTQLFLGCNDQTTAEYISGRAGDATVKVKTEQHTRLESPLTMFRNSSTGDGKRQVMTADEIIRMPNDKCLVILRAKNVLLANKFDYSLLPIAKDMKPAPMRERPSIYDDAAREEWRRKDEAYMIAARQRSHTENIDPSDESEARDTHCIIVLAHKVRDFIVSKLAMQRVTSSSQRDEKPFLIGQTSTVQVDNLSELGSYTVHENLVVDTDSGEVVGMVDGAIATVYSDTSGLELFGPEVSEKTILEEVAIEERKQAAEQIIEGGGKESLAESKLSCKDEIPDEIIDLLNGLGR